jgi:hypothetical protein
MDKSQVVIVNQCHITIRCLLQNKLQSGRARDDQKDTILRRYIVTECEGDLDTDTAKHQKNIWEMINWDCLLLYELQCL